MVDGGKRGENETDYSFRPRRDGALIATTIVLTDISTAPIQSGRTNPAPANTPAARGKAMAL